MLLLSLLRTILPSLLAIFLIATCAHVCFAQNAPKSIESLASADLSALSDQARARYQFGHRQLRDGDLAGALESFTQVIEENPDFADGYLSRAQVYRRLEKVAPDVEERDRAALGYINDERRVIKEMNRQFVGGDLKSLFTVRTIVLLTIYLVFWLAVMYPFWLEGEQLPLGLLNYFITSLLMLAVPDGPIRYGLFIAGLVTHILTAYSKLRGKKRANKLADDSPLEAGLRELRRKTAFSDANEFETETETKLCPNCSREVNAIARVCPRCDTRF